MAFRGSTKPSYNVIGIMFNFFLGIMTKECRLIMSYKATGSQFDGESKISQSHIPKHKMHMHFYTHKPLFTWQL